jgi:AAA family ATP:ADP antiporter
VVADNRSPDLSTTTLRANGGSNDVESAPPLFRQLTSGALLGIRPGEGSTAWLLFFYFFLLATIHYVGKSVRDSTYVDSLGATQLPFAYLAVALVSFPVLVLYARLTARFSQRLLIVSWSVIQAIGLVFFFWLFGYGSGWVSIAFYVWTAVAFGIGLSQYWSYANHRLDPRQARRLFAFIGAGGLLGAVPGGQIAKLMSVAYSTRSALLAAAALSLLTVGFVWLLERRRFQQPLVRRRTETMEQIRSARGGLRALRGSRLLLLIAALMFLATAVNQIVDLQFKWAVEEAKKVGGLEQLTTTFGDFYSVMGLLAFVFQIFFTQRIHRRLGVAFGLRVLPVSVAVSTVLLLLAYGPLMLAPLAAAYVLKLSETGFRHSVEQSSRELLFMPVPSPLRLQAKAFIDLFVQRVARGAAAILLLPVAYHKVGPEHVGWATLLLVVLWLWVTAQARREYVSAFRDGLRAGVMDQLPAVDVNDVTTITTLVEALGSADPRQVLHSLELLAVSGQHRLVPPLLLHHEDARVRRKVLAILAAARRTEAIPLVERAIADGDLEVRTAAIQSLTALKGGDAASWVLPRLEDPDPRIRAAAVASLSGMPDREMVERAEAVLNDLIASDQPDVRMEAAHAVAEIREPVAAGSVVQLLYDSNRSVVRAAINAVEKRLERDGPNPLYVPILISLMGNRRLRKPARDAIVAYGERAISALVLFMNAEEEQIWVRRAVPMTIAQINSPAAVTSLVDGLSSADPWIRRKIIEALAYLRTRHPEIRIRHDSVADEIRRDAYVYLRSLADLWSVSSWHEARFDGPYAQWQTAGRVPTLLQQVLAQRMATAVENIFRLLKLIHPPRDIEATYRSLGSGQQALRATALEYLDNSLTGGVRRDVFAAIDDTPIEDKLRRAAQLFDITTDTPEETLGRLLEPDPKFDPGAVLTFAAIHAVYTERITDYYATVGDLVRDTDNPILRETAEWVIWKLGLQKEPADSSDRADLAAGGTADMKKMALIEKVVLLQGVDLFAACNAEQVLQLASIAREIWFKTGGLIYQRNEPPDALYCIVEGKVDLAGDEGEPIRRGTGETFGVIDILRAQLRSRNATAATATHALVIEADDFFDLLATNVDIVRAMFTQLTLAISDVPAGLQ